MKLRWEFVRGADGKLDEALVRSTCGRVEIKRSTLPSGAHYYNARDISVDGRKEIEQGWDKQLVLKACNAYAESHFTNGELFADTTEG